MIATKAQWTHKLAKWVSRVLNPLVVLPPVLATASFQAPHGLIEGAKWLAVTVVFSIVVPASAVLWQLRRGGISGWDIPERRHRLKPAVVGSAAVAALAPLGAIVMFNGPVELLAIYAAGLAQTVLSLSITSFWKISQHALSIAAAASTMYAFLGAVAAPVLLLIPLVCWARVRTGAHTRLQVIAGAAMGVSITPLCLRAFGLF